MVGETNLASSSTRIDYDSPGSGGYTPDMKIQLDDDYQIGFLVI